MKWFGVKTIYRHKVTGKNKTKKNVDKKSILLEERVVLFQARSLDSAIKKAEKEAMEYSSTAAINPYGQKINVEFLKCVEAFKLFEGPADGVEVYSQTELHPLGMSKREAISRKYGSKLSEKKDQDGRYKFLDGDFIWLK